MPKWGPFYGSIAESVRSLRDEQWHNQINAKGYFCVFCHFHAAATATTLSMPTRPSYAFIARWTKDVLTRKRGNNGGRDSNGNSSFPSLLRKRLTRTPFNKVPHYSLAAFRRPFFITHPLAAGVSFGTIFINYHNQKSRKKHVADADDDESLSKYEGFFPPSQSNEFLSERNDKRRQLIVV